MKSDSEEMLSFSYNSQTADVSISSDSSHSRSSQVEYYILSGRVLYSQVGYCTPR